MLMEPSFSLHLPFGASCSLNHTMTWEGDLGCVSGSTKEDLRTRGFGGAGLGDVEEGGGKETGEEGRREMPLHSQAVVLTHLTGLLGLERSLNFLSSSFCLSSDMPSRICLSVILVTSRLILRALLKEALLVFSNALAFSSDCFHRSWRMREREESTEWARLGLGLGQEQRSIELPIKAYLNLLGHCF